MPARRHDATYLRQHEGARRTQPVRDEVLRHRAHEPPDHPLPHVVEDARGHLEPVAGGLKALLATARPKQRALKVSLGVVAVVGTWKV